MRDAAIARNYAEALFTLGERTDATESFAELLDALAGAISADERVRAVIESPQVPKGKKAEVLRRTLEGRTPPAFQQWIQAVVRRGRQTLFGEISREMQALLDVKFNRVHAGITLARSADPALQAEIARRLSEALGKTVIPHFRADASLLGGIVVRVGDRVIDGSIRRRLKALRRTMLGG